MRHFIATSIASALIAGMTGMMAPAQAATSLDLHAQLCSAKAAKAVTGSSMKLLSAETVTVGVADTVVEEVSYSLPDSTRCDLLLATSELAKAGKPVFVTYDYRITATRAIVGYYPFDYTIRNGAGTNQVIPVGASFTSAGVALPAGTVELASVVYATSGTGQYSGANYTDNANKMTYNVLARAASYIAPVRVTPSEEDKAAAQAVHDQDVAKAQEPVTKATDTVAAAKKAKAKAKAKVKKAVKAKSSKATVKKAQKTLRKATAAQKKAKKVLKRAKATYEVNVRAADRRYATAISSKIVDTEIPAKTSDVIAGTFS